MNRDELEAAGLGEETRRWRRADVTEESRQWRRGVVRRFPNLVDLGMDEFNEAVVAEMIRWLLDRRGRWEMFNVAEDDIFTRYCFAAAEDARAFHHRFGAFAEKAVLRIPS